MGERPRVVEDRDLALLGTWRLLGLTLGAYYLYLILDIAHGLWAQGSWFSENDLLHIGLIQWTTFITLVVVKKVEDAPEPALTVPHSQENGSTEQAVEQVVPRLGHGGGLCEGRLC